LFAPLLVQVRNILAHTGTFDNRVSVDTSERRSICGMLASTRRETVIVSGSVVFRPHNLVETFEWLR
jgi:hypothetical protein